MLTPKKVVFTAYAAVAAAVAIAINAGIIYVIVHFVRKFW